MENRNHLKIVHNSNDKFVEKMHNDLKERPLNTEELLVLTEDRESSPRP